MLQCHPDFAIHTRFILGARIIAPASTMTSTRIAYRAGGSSVSNRHWRLAWEWVGRYIDASPALLDALCRHEGAA